MALIEDIEDLEVVSTKLPTLISDVEALVADFKAQEDAAAKVQALADDLAKLALAVGAVAGAIKENE